MLLTFVVLELVAYCHIQQYFSYIYLWQHLDVQAAWRRKLTYGQAPNAFEILTFV